MNKKKKIICSSSNNNNQPFLAFRFFFGVYFQIFKFSSNKCHQKFLKSKPLLIISSKKNNPVLTYCACYWCNKKPRSPNQIKKKPKKIWINLQKITGCTFGNLRLKTDVENETGVAVQLKERKNPNDTNYRKQYDKPTRDTHTHVLRDRYGSRSIKPIIIRRARNGDWTDPNASAAAAIDKQIDGGGGKWNLSAQWPHSPLFFPRDDKLTAPCPVSFKMYWNLFCVMCPDRFDKILLPTHSGESIDKNNGFN